MSTRIDPSLSHALSGNADNVGPLNVFLKISFPKNVKTPDERASKVAALIRRVEGLVQTTPKFQFRELDNVLQVKAPTEFVRQLIGEPEVLAASSVPHFESAMIEPVGRREVDSSAINRPFSAPRRTTPRGNR